MKQFEQDKSRRKFITTVASAGTIAMLNPFFSWAIDDTDPKVAAIVAKTIGIDAHNHVDVPLNLAELPGPAVDLSNEMKKSGLSAICMTFAVDYQKLVNPGDGYERFINGLDAMDILLKSNNIKRSLNLSDVQSSHKKKQSTIIQSVEGGHFLEGHVDRLAIAYKRGLRHLTLLHDNDASIPLGDVFTNPAKWGGLTKFGAEVIEECNRLGILVDLSHANAETVIAALKIAKQPVIISHTGLDTQLGENQNMAKMMRPRLISKEQAKIVADAGGVIGVWTHLADSALTYAENVKAMVNVAGIDHVCIGTDTKLTPSYRTPGQLAGRPTNQGQARPGERTNFAWQDQKNGFYYTVVDALLKTGFKEHEIAKVGGGNFLRVFDAATKGHS